MSPYKSGKSRSKWASAQTPFGSMSEVGFWQHPPRSEGGFRLYSADDLSALEFIRNLQTLGFSLNEIREFISLRTNDLHACSEVRKMLDHKPRDIHAKRVALVKLEDELKSALAKCNSRLRRPRSNRNDRCPVLTVFGKSKHQVRHED